MTTAKKKSIIVSTELNQLVSNRDKTIENNFENHPKKTKSLLIMQANW